MDPTSNHYTAPHITYVINPEIKHWYILRALTHIQADICTRINRNITWDNLVYVTVLNIPLMSGPSGVTHNTINGLLKRSDRFCRWLLNVPMPRLMLTRAEHKIWQSSSISRSRIDAVELSGDLIAWAGAAWKQQLCNQQTRELTSA